MFISYTHIYFPINVHKIIHTYDKSQYHVFKIGVITVVVYFFSFVHDILYQVHRSVLMINIGGIARFGTPMTIFKSGSCLQVYIGPGLTDCCSFGCAASCIANCIVDGIAGRFTGSWHASSCPYHELRVLLSFYHRCLSYELASPKLLPLVLNFGPCQWCKQHAIQFNLKLKVLDHSNIMHFVGPLSPLNCFELQALRI